MSLVRGPLARPLPAPITANSVDWPLIHYGGEVNALNFTLDDSEEENPGWGRITFEKFDALRVCRGEYSPYEVSREESDWSWIWTVEDSPWLAERYAYEKKHYGTSYGWGGDVDEMVREFSHYLFRFHDQFVEVICAGFWFETSPRCLRDQKPGPLHPASNLPASSVIDTFEAHGIKCQIWKNPRPIEALVTEAAFGSQKLFQFAPELDGETRPSWTLSLRIRDQRSFVTLETFGRRVEARYQNIPALEQIKPVIEKWLGEVAQRRMQK